MKAATRRDVLKAAAAVTMGRAAAAGNVRPRQISSEQGLRAEIAADGSYQVTASTYGWTFAGTLGQAPDNIMVSEGSDGVGSWIEIAADYQPSRSSAIRIYHGNSVVLFSTRYGADGPNADAFPHFTTYPHDLFTFSYGGLWSYWFNRLNVRSPWLFYDAGANAFLFSPASNFMTGVSQFASDGAMEAAIDGRIGALPAGFTHRAVLAFGHGINGAFESWGRTLTGLSGKRRPANDAITLLNKFSYWTDAGAAYYYHPQDATQYIPTLLSVPTAFNQLGVPVASMELDSWLYPKGAPASWTRNDSGMATFQADAAVMPKGLQAFRQVLGLSLISHARWIDAQSPLRKMYKMSGNVSIDPKYWQDYAAYLAANGVEVLEQDWLSNNAVTDFNLTDGDAFLDNMASGMAAAGRNLMYCMALSSHMMQSTKYDNVLAARVSEDGFARKNWDALLFDSHIASAVGLWPFADNFMSPNVKDVLLATLTAGPVGSGDAAGSINAENLRQAVRSDGVIVKPDAAIVPLDATYIAQSSYSTAPMIASTYTDHDGRRTAYVFAYERTKGAMSSIAFTPESVGVKGPAYVYDYFQGTGSVVEAGGQFTATVDYNASYYIVAPIGPSGIAFLGDAGKFVSCGKKRIDILKDDGSLNVMVQFARQESEVVLHLYSRVRPFLPGVSGRMSRFIPEGNDRYRITVSSEAGRSASLILRTR